MAIELMAPFLIGLLGSLHCLGMCGPLVMAYAVHIKSPDTRTAALGPLSLEPGIFSPSGLSFRKADDLWNTGRPGRRPL